MSAYERCPSSYGRCLLVEALLSVILGFHETSSNSKIVHFTVVCLESRPLNRSEAGGDFVVIQTFFSNVNYSVIM